MDFPDASHTGGAVNGFTPNMSQEQIEELDRRRGMGDDGPFNDPAELVNKKPWLNKDGTHKSNEDGMHKTKEATAILKGAMRVPEGGETFAKPELPKREGESEQERQVRSHVVDEKHDPDKYPGGRKQAIAIGISEAEHKSVDDGDKDDKMSDLGDKLFGKANPFKAASERARDRAAGRKERTIGMRHAGARSIGKGDVGELKSEKDDVDVLERLLDHEKKEMESEEKALPGELAQHASSPSLPAPTPPPPPPAPVGKGIFSHQTLGPRGMGAGGGAGGGAPAPAPSPAPTPAPAPSSGGVGPSMGLGKSMEAIKALNSRSFHIQPPLAPYDPFGVHRNATSVPTSGSSPYEGQPMTLKAQVDAHATCPTHGITYQKALGCHPCNIQKCQECEKCGSQMHKSMGGVLRCPRGH